MNINIVIDLYYYNLIFFIINLYSHKYRYYGYKYLVLFTT